MRARLNEAFAATTSWKRGRLAHRRGSKSVGLLRAWSVANQQKKLHSCVIFNGLWAVLLQRTQWSVLQRISLEENSICKRRRVVYNDPFEGVRISVWKWRALFNCRHAWCLQFFGWAWFHRERRCFVDLMNSSVLVSGGLSARRAKVKLLAINYRILSCFGLLLAKEGGVLTGSYGAFQL